MSDITSNFKFSIPDYKRNIDPLKHYMETTSFIRDKIKHTKDSRSTIKEYIIAKERFNNPTVYFRQRDLDGKLSKKAESLKSYLDDVKEEGDIMVPSGTVYFSTDKKLSLHSEFTIKNTKERSVHKKLAFKYKMENAWDKFLYHNTIQKTKKIFNNSLSGAYASAGTILNNPSAHYTLTSMTRAISGIGNTLSEVLISGNRHYRNPDVMINHIAAIARYADLDRVEKTINKFKLYTPTADEAMAYLLKSSSKYWKDTSKELIIYNFLKSLTIYERAAVIYHIDLNAIKEFNDEFMRNFIKDFLDYEDMNFTENESKAIIDNASELVANISTYSLSDVLKGKKKDEYTTSDLSKLASLINNTNKTLGYFSEIIRTFFITDIFPANISRVKDMVREAIVLSDTDSTCASYEDWPDWYYGKPTMDSNAVAISSLILFITTEAMDHYIKLFGVNLNISYSKAQVLSMKNEFMWDVFVSTNVSKHYYANITIQEGNIYNFKDMHETLEKKGVNLIAPNAYGPIRELVDDMMLGIMEDVRTVGKIELTKYLNMVMDAEQMLMRKLDEGSPEIFKLEKIKDAKVYKNEPNKSPYFHHMLWNTVLSERYGEAPDPTYLAVKVPMRIKTKADMKMFLDSFVDQGLADELREFLIKHDKAYVGTFRLPLVKLYEQGIPDVFKGWIDVKRVVKDNCNALYMVLETIGYFIKEDSILSEIEG